MRNPLSPNRSAHLGVVELGRIKEVVRPFEIDRSEKIPNLFRAERRRSSSDQRTATTSFTGGTNTGSAIEIPLNIPLKKRLFGQYRIDSEMSRHRLSPMLIVQLHCLNRVLTAQLKSPALQVKLPLSNHTRQDGGNASCRSQTSPSTPT